jgi:hypothetical protein
LGDVVITNTLFLAPPLRFASLLGSPSYSFSEILAHLESTMKGSSFARP